MNVIILFHLEITGEIAICSSPADDCKPFVWEVDGDKLKTDQGYKMFLLVNAYPREHFENNVNGDVLSDGEPTQKRRRKAEVGNTYQAELVLSNGQVSALKEGEYELTLKKRSITQALNPSLKNNSVIGWQHFFSLENSENMDLPFKESPVLVMRVSHDGPSDTSSRKAKSPSKVKREPGTSPRTPTNVKEEGLEQVQKEQPTAESSKESKLMPRIMYRFYHNNEIQTTFGSTNFSCPWCQLNCIQMRSLAYHLKHCHSRFNFAFTFEPKAPKEKLEAKIDITPNESYDGSYSGNPFDQSYATTGFAFSRNGPVRRAPVTMILVGVRKQNMEGIDPDDDDLDYLNPIIMGHDRLYYHTNTCLPIRPQDMDIDSEEENDPEWMRTKTQLVTSVCDDGLALFNIYCFSDDR